MEIVAVAAAASGHGVGKSQIIVIVESVWTAEIASVWGSRSLVVGYSSGKTSCGGMLLKKGRTVVGWVV